MDRVPHQCQQKGLHNFGATGDDWCKQVPQNPSLLLHCTASSRAPSMHKDTIYYCVCFLSQYLDYGQWWFVLLDVLCRVMLHQIVWNTFINRGRWTLSYCQNSSSIILSSTAWKFMRQCWNCTCAESSAKRIQACRRAIML